jgi:hypothetical protein
MDRRSCRLHQDHRGKELLAALCEITTRPKTRFESHVFDTRCEDLRRDYQFLAHAWQGCVRGSLRPVARMKDATASDRRPPRRLSAHDSASAPGVDHRRRDGITAGAPIGSVAPARLAETHASKLSKRWARSTRSRSSNAGRAGAATPITITSCWLRAVSSPKAVQSSES